VGEMGREKRGGGGGWWGGERARGRALVKKEKREHIPWPP